MGLDMYLTAKLHTVDRDWASEKERKINKEVRKLIPEMFDSGNLNTIEVGFEVGYWRKANAIHQWFVDKCQDGNDDCRSSFVSRTDLQDLKTACENELKTKDNPEESDEQIEPSAGFFFGTYEKDEWYYGALEETIKIVTKCLELPEEWDFYYQSSW